MDAARHSRTIFYGWWIVAAAFTINAFAWSTRASFAVVYDAMLKDLGWSRAEAVLGYAISWLVLAAFAPLTGWLYDRAGPRVVVPTGGCALAAGLLATSRATVAWQYDLSYGVLVGFGIAATLSPGNALVSRWFVRRRGTALGVVAAGSSLGTLVSLPVVAWAIAVVGWRTALVWYGLVLLILLTVLPALVYRTSPRSLGLEPDGGGGPAPARVRIRAERTWTAHAAAGTFVFWATFVMLMLGVVAFQVVTTHQIAFTTDKGIGAERAAAIFGLVGVFQLVGNLTGGVLSDRWGRQRVFIAGSVLGLAAIVLLASVAGPGDLWKLYAFAAAMGIGFGARISLLSAIPADAFAGPSFGLVLGMLQAGSGLGGFAGPTLGGVIYDASGSYMAAFAAAGAAVLLSGAAAWFARPPAPVPADAAASLQAPSRDPESLADLVKPVRE